MLKITNEDNMALMARYTDKHFDLAIVDPPYGIDYGGMLKGKGNGNGGIDKNGWKSYNAPDWDKSIPSKEYFNELFRVSKNQIIWGGNYMTQFLPPSMGWLIWDKGQRDFSLADGELAWSSFKKALRIFTMSRGKALAQNNGGGGRFHPTQKPVDLYKWIIDKYANQGDKILDTHLGSGSIAIACHDYNFDLTACELDTEYYNKAIDRINNHTKQQKLF